MYTLPSRSDEQPCRDGESLLSTPPEELSAEQRAALDAHLAFCEACATIWQKDRYIDDVLKTDLRREIEAAPTLPLPPRLQRLWKWETS